MLNWDTLRLTKHKKRKLLNKTRLPNEKLLKIRRILKEKKLKLEKIKKNRNSNKMKKKLWLNKCSINRFLTKKLNKIRIKFKRCIYRKPNLVFVNNEAFNNECSICLTHGNMKTLKCGHSYHKKCLLKWVKSCHQQNTIACCATCRQPIEFKKAIELPKEEPNYISDYDSYSDSYSDYDY